MNRVQPIGCAFSLMTVLALAFMLSGCGTNAKKCGEECTSNSDCAGDLECVQTPAQGSQVCVQDDCAICISSGYTCSYDPNTCAMITCHQ